MDAENQNEERGEFQFEIVPMELDDLEDVIAIENECFTSPWTPDLFVGEFYNRLSRRYVALVKSAKPKRILAGYIIYWRILADEYHIMSVATTAKYRRMGAAQALIKKCSDEAGDARLASVMLEVRVTNEGAQALYTKLGFKPIGLRRGYYADNGEDALLMELALKDGKTA